MNQKKNQKRDVSRVFSLLLVFILLCTMPNYPVSAEVLPAAEVGTENPVLTGLGYGNPVTLRENNGVLEYCTDLAKTTWTAYTGTITIQGSPGQIEVTSGEHSVILDGTTVKNQMSISESGTILHLTMQNAALGNISVAYGVTADLTLTGTNTLGGSGDAALYVNDGTVEITSASTGSLTTSRCDYGIQVLGTRSQLTINGGTVNAIGINESGIGGTSGTITITGGTVTATSQVGIGIRGSDEASYPTVNITGGVVTAQSTSPMGLADINGTANISGGMVTADGIRTAKITGGSVKARTSAGSTGITNATDGDGHAVSLTTVKVGETPVTNSAITGITTSTGSYGSQDVQTDAAGKLYLYLPADSKVTKVTTDEAGLDVSGKKGYGGSVDAGDEGTLAEMEKPLSGDFSFTAPSNLTYDGTAKTASVAALTGKTTGSVTVKYYDEENNEVEPIRAGSYKAKIDVAEAGKYYAATDLTDEGSWSFTIQKAAIAANKPEETMEVPYTNKTVGSVALPTGWSWDEADQETALIVGSAVEATANYTAADKDSYETNAVTVKITRQACIHSWDAGKVTKEPTTTEEGVKTYTCSICGVTRTEAIPKLAETVTEVPTGTKLTDTTTKANYTVTASDTVSYTSPTNKKATTVKIPETVTIDGVTYKVTSIAASAFKNNKKLKKVTIAGNITTIGAKAFYGCKSLKSITIKTTALTKKSVGSKAFKGISSKATIKVPKKKLASYKKILKAKGVGSSVKIKK